MEIIKQQDGSNKVIFDNGEVIYVQKGIDPIDGSIDIGLIQRKTADFLENQNSINEYFRPKQFFYVMGEYYAGMALFKPQCKEWYVKAINAFNVEIKKQQKLREGTNVIRNQSGKENNKENKGGKYKIWYKDTLPDLVPILNDTSEYIENPVEKHQFCVAYALLKFINCKIDIRKIVARISELNGYCAFLEKTAPDVYHAYTILADNIGFYSELDVDIYYQTLNSIKEWETLIGKKSK